MTQPADARPDKLSLNLLQGCGHGRAIPTVSTVLAPSICALNAPRCTCARCEHPALRLTAPSISLGPQYQTPSDDPFFCPADFGEMTLWWGIWFLCIALLREGYWVSIVSPLFVMLLILKGSGVPMQEKQVCGPLGFL